MRHLPLAIAVLLGGVACHEPTLPPNHTPAYGFDLAGDVFQRLLDLLVALLEQNPFPERPPRYVRALLYQYHFTNFAERKESGTWWRRDLVEPYSPIMSHRGKD